MKNFRKGLLIGVAIGAGAYLLMLVLMELAKAAA